MLRGSGGASVIAASIGRVARRVLSRPDMKTQHVLSFSGWVLSSILSGALVSACASAGTEPHAMTAGQHQAAAKSEEQSAAGHQTQYDPSATEARRNVRWRSEENPTDEHRKQAELHRKVAEKHRAAAKTLVEAEKRFCSGISEADRDLSPFSHREDIAAVQALKEEFDTSDVYSRGSEIRAVEVQQIEKEVFGPGGLQGARVTFRAVPGMTPEWLQRAVDCHLARNAVIGDESAMSFCPLAVPHATASVRSTGNGFAVDVTSDDQGSAKEIVKRAWAFGPAGPNVLK